jgi:hypothetical protein
MYWRAIEITCSYSCPMAKLFNTPVLAMEMCGFTPPERVAPPSPDVVP